MPSLEGTSLGRYRLGRRLGRGGMSEVYLAHDDLMNREVAVKVVSSTHTDYIERFQREAEAIGRLQHDHILPAYDLGEQNDLESPHHLKLCLRDLGFEHGMSSLKKAGPQEPNSSYPWQTQVPRSLFETRMGRSSTFAFPVLLATLEAAQQSLA